jgi:hypothetical protein
MEQTTLGSATISERASGQLVLDQKSQTLERLIGQFRVSNETRRALRRPRAA